MLKEYRRALHRIPELGWELPKTEAYVRQVLEGFSCEVFSPLPHALCALFDFGQEKTVAFRADMDALPITEATGLPYASLHPGQMHACGHDGHMAMLLGLGAYLSQKKEHEKNVLLIFQPAEETVGGAQPLCETGLLERYAVERIYGLHLWPALDKGVLGSCPGGMMARSCELTVELFGRSVHLARWETGNDALAAAAQLINRLYAMAEGKPCLLRFGKLVSGSVRNALSDHSRLEGSLRCFDDRLYAQLRQQIPELAEEVAGSFGCTARVHCTSGYPPVQNDPVLFDGAKLGYPQLVTVEPTYITEDFSQYQQRVPGVFFWLGTGGSPLHSPCFDFDEEVLEIGLSFLKTLL